MTTRKCPVCGKTFEAHMRQKYCNPQCAEKASLDLRQKRCEKEKKKRAQAREERERKKKTTSLAQDAMDARDNGMTYGKYMAERYKVTINRCSRGDEMSNFSQSGNIKCPYFVNAKNEKKEANYITCEGIGYVRYYTSKFKNKEERNKHITGYCAKYPNKCAICIANDTKFQREER